MPPFDFPASPTTGQVYAPTGGPAYQWDGEKWKGGQPSGPVTEQDFDVSGLAYKDLAVPTWAKQARLTVNMRNTTGNIYVALRVSVDGVNYLAGAADYANAGPYHQTAGPTPYLTQPVQTGSAFILTIGGDNFAIPHKVTGTIDVTRPNTSTTLAYQGQGVSYNNTANQGWATNQIGGYVATASLGSALSLKGLRLLAMGGTYGPGSSIHVEWLGDAASVPISNAIADAPNDQGRYVRSGNAWVGEAFSFRNKLINGGMDISQRGTSFASPATNAYTLDRWTPIFDGAGAFTVSRQPLGVNYAPSKYALQWYQGTAISGCTYRYIVQKIEGVETFSGKTVTISFTASCGILASFQLSTLLLQYFGTGGSPSASVNVVSPPVTVIAGGSRHSLTLTVPSIAGKTLGTNNNDYFALYFTLPTTGTFDLYLWDVQVEEGPVATPFERRPIALELSLCKRYYQTLYSILMSTGWCAAGTPYFEAFTYLAEMRAVPTATFSAFANSNASNMVMNSATAQMIRVSSTATATGSANATATITFDAEL